ncbi:hypothetical protein TEA_010557 [Camellia sinensis var. sinensis]|uniref:Eukaryotic translation initiation factor 2 subunit beta n=2 Tax=Camellia sinensis TaxID=4442 RepID=A0A4V3WMW9_CAMSN|nr:hypothetical protein TEA_010557 [Camellia sinensis var. sinensis]
MKAKKNGLCESRTTENEMKHGFDCEDFSPYCKEEEREGKKQEGRRRKGELEGKAVPFKSGLDGGGTADESAGGGTGRGPSSAPLFSPSLLLFPLFFSCVQRRRIDFDTIMADEENPNEVKEELADNAPFDPTKKKKKKKVVIQDPADDAVDNLAEKTESLSVSDGLESTFSGLKKKKKKSVHTDLLSDEKESVVDDLDDHIGDDEEGEGIILQPQFPWEGSDRDYKYEELLDRVFHILRENNPELAGDRRRTVMRPPQVLREGTKKTVFVNFMDLCKTMHRQPEHVMTFLLAEMGTSGSLDGQQRLVVKGRFAPKNFEGILRRYVNEYVICNGCKSPDTILSKENRLFFLRCEKCGSGRSVAPIKAGFVARVGRRKAGT